ncbi:cysteine hydrolase family protein [Aneurinibacillus uraniidurans]|uniref:cysteine hydrolase family protein n=1 Tax=Aneurinibacillus uraniidurans TaxID=2966586 RepID=UPI00234B706D|nr:isochorismatase family cysteine hydrolase [Aneurinibacillus sp. B1]WCN39304.1 cysteine hydrolase [Aneurinibacillus sp. B1]
MKAFINIDYTVDFVADNGALTCGEAGQAIGDRLAELTKQFVQAGDFTVMAIDLHFADDVHHPEYRLYPPHNIKGAPGRELYGAVREVYETHRSSIMWLDKTRYSAFCNTGLADELRKRSITEVHLGGVCTDICVLHTAVDAYNLGFTVVIHEDAVASFDPVGHTWALNHFKNALGFTVVHSSNR